MRKEVIIGMVGAGGDGVVAAGETLLSAAALDGLYGRLQKSFGPQIRGGESSVRIRVSTESVRSAGDDLDLLVIFSWKDYARFGLELPVGEYGLVLYEAKLPHSPKEITPTGKCKREAIPVPFEELAVTKAGTALAKNIVALGVLSEHYNIAPDRIKNGIERKFMKKGEKVVMANISAFEGGREWARTNLKGVSVRRLEYKTGETKMILDGNDAVSVGAIFAGCNFFAGYPITPASEIMHLLTDELPRYGASYVQAEDEIAAAAMCAGASFAGAKAMTATSGPGMSLKSEILGMASMAELPMVIVNVQRGGPSTGLPTKGEQADLFQAAFSANGDVVRPILAPRDIVSCFHMTVEAFNIAEEYQTPVIVLTDQFLGHSKVATDKVSTEGLTLKYRKTPDPKQAGNYKRFEMTKDNISPMAIPGTPDMQYLASGIEHDSRGWPNSEAEQHRVMTEKRTKKLDPLRKRDDLFTKLGDPKASFGIISWGCSAGSVRDAFEIGEEKGIKFKVLIPYLIAPTPVETYREFFKGLKGLLIVEVNHLGQLYKYLRTELDFPMPVKTLTMAGGTMFAPEEVLDAMVKMQKELKHG